MNIEKALKNSIIKLKLYGIPSTCLDTEVLLLEVLNRIRYKKINHNNTKNKVTFHNYFSYDNKKLHKSWLYINNNYELTKKEENLFKNFIDQRKKQKPVAYIISRKEFFGYDFYVNENVLIPRPETEFIVEEVTKILDKQARHFIIKQKKINLVDIGTGSGCIIISILNELAKHKKNKIIYNSYANDISAKSIEIAKFNAKKYNLIKKIKFVTCDLEKFLRDNSSLFADQFIMTVNLPYINDNNYKNLSPNVKKYEPKVALKGGKNGLDLIKKLIKQIAHIRTNLNVNSNNYIIFEADPIQMAKIKLLLKKELNILDIKIIKDLNGKNRIILAKI